MRVGVRNIYNFFFVVSAVVLIVINEQAFVVNKIVNLVFA